MGLEESAPLLSKLWPTLVTLGGGAALIALLRSFVYSYSAGGKKVRFSGRPQDEDNYVFRDSAEDEGRDDNETYEEYDDEDRGDDTPQIPYSMKRFVGFVFEGVFDLFMCSHFCTSSVTYKHPVNSKVVKMLSYCRKCASLQGYFHFTDNSPTTVVWITFDNLKKGFEHCATPLHQNTPLFFSHAHPFNGCHVRSVISSYPLTTK